MNRVLPRCCAVLLLLALGACWGHPVQAAPVTCTASATNVAFGSVNPQNSQTNANGTLSYTCTNNSPSVHYITACFSIGYGVQSGAQINPRQMTNALGNILKFQLYQDPTLSTIWGSQTIAGTLPLMVNVIVPANGSNPGTATIYGQVLGGQTTAVPGSYQDVFSGSNTAVTVKDGGNKFPGNCDNTIVGTFPFTASATVVNQCTVSAGTLNFGTVGLLTAAVTGTSTITVQCPLLTSYNVGLDAGQNGGGNINARAMVLGANSIGYQLYQNPGLTTVWGNTVGTNTVAGIGTGLPQNYTVYGNVPPQPTPPAGTYNDTITVTVSTEPRSRRWLRMQRGQRIARGIQQRQGVVVALQARGRTQCREHAAFGCHRAGRLQAGHLGGHHTAHVQGAVVSERVRRAVAVATRASRDVAAGVEPQGGGHRRGHRHARHGRKLPARAGQAAGDRGGGRCRRRGRRWRGGGGRGVARGVHAATGQRHRRHQHEGNPTHGCCPPPDGGSYHAPRMLNPGWSPLAGPGPAPDAPPVVAGSVSCPTSRPPCTSMRLRNAAPDTAQDGSLKPLRVPTPITTNPGRSRGLPGATRSRR